LIKGFGLRLRLFIRGLKNLQNDNEKKA